MANIRCETSYKWGIIYQTTISRSEDEPVPSRTSIETSIVREKDNYYSGKSIIFAQEIRDFMDTSLWFKDIPEEEVKKRTQQLHDSWVEKIRSLYEKGEKIPIDFFREHEQALLARSEST